jgi:ribosomal protein S6--L-glutamate ligase
MIPSATAQLASRSKAFQAEILKPWMIPETTVIYNRHQLLETTNHYHKKNIGQVILKQDRKNAGMGILLYGTIEDIYNQAAHKALAYPFVLQPFLPGCIDMRIVILDGYTEAYQRCNPYSFRNNLHCGGKASPCVLSEEAHQFCGEVMARGSFPYGHLDLMVNGEGILYLAEINLRGGIRGARIGKGEYDKRVDAIEKKLLARFLNEAQADPV